LLPSSPFFNVSVTCLRTGSTDSTLWQSEGVPSAEGGVKE
jgi:hypothetical protein